MKSQDFNLNVYITHFVAPSKTFGGVIKSYIELRMNLDYLRSWIRLLKHGTRGHQPWKKDVMTDARALETNNRLRYLYEVLTNLNLLKVKNLKINIITNSDEISKPFKSELFGKNIKFHIYKKYKKYNWIHNSPWVTTSKNSPWLLTWEHKKLILEDLINSDQDSLFLYLENDIKFTQSNLEYWLRHKDRLSKLGLIPSFTLMEYSETRSKWVSVSEFRNSPLKFDDLKSTKIDSVDYVNLNNPYCACYLMDLEMVNEYSKSQAFSEVSSRSICSWDIGARSAMGLTFVAIPQNFSSRSVVPVHKNGSVYTIEPGALLEHLTNLYSKVSTIETNMLDINQLIIE